MAEFLDAVSNAFYSYILIALLVFSGIYFTIRTKFLQFRLFPESLRVIREPKQDDAGLSSFGALMVSTASRVGTGNIAGASVAVTLGGPGALFWMWMVALAGGASAFVESTLAQIYKRRSENGDSYGGPAYYITTALKARPLGMIFAIALIVTYMGGFNMVASYNTIDSFTSYGWFTEGSTPLLLGIGLAAFAAAPIFGGGKRLARVTEFLVPFMALAYLAVGLAVIFTHLDLVPGMISSIFTNAFDFESIFGGFAGSALMLGIKRGLYSNEAGVGSAPNAAASANVSHPAKQGLVQMLSVYIDTLLICSITGFMILASGVARNEDNAGVTVVQESASTVLGGLGHPFVTMSLVLFAFTTLIGNYYYSEINLRFLCNGEPPKAVLIAFRAAAVFIVFSGSLLEFTMAWGIADILMGIMALINIPVIIVLGRRAIRAANDYVEQRKAGRNPVYVASANGVTEHTDFWQTSKETPLTYHGQPHADRLTD